MRLLTRSWLLCLLLPLATQAHDARPLSVTMLEQAAGTYRVVVRAPPSLSRQDAPAVIWPESCSLLENAPLASAIGNIVLVSCPGGLQGQVIHLDYPGFNPSITALFRLEGIDGTSLTAVLPPDELQWEVPVNPGLLQVAGDYTVLGIEHIWLGIDHLLFVAGLILLARSPRRIVLAITGFTVAHSITLALATLGLVRFPVTLVEALIALSIVFLAGEIARCNSTSFSHRYPVLLSFAFGLLHGFGFASVLGEIGLPAQALLTGLLFFNMGVEIGQLAFIALLLGLLALFRLLAQGRLKVPVPPMAWPMAAAYVIGIPAAYWFLERSMLAIVA